MIRLTLTAATLVAAGCASTQPRHTAQNDSPERHNDFVGARGPQGPAGATGPQGPKGQTGPSGYAAVGPRGPQGPAGETGEQGLTGARGPEGDLAVGPTGAVGARGDTGAQGPAGQTGARGASAEGYAGPAGPAGPAGARGPTGDTGAKGPTLVGPAGPAGSAGPTGQRGGVGQTGAQGATTAGLAGATGVSGPAGPRGITGPTGPQGPAGAIARWTNYREFWFDANGASIHSADQGKVSDIAAYLRQNPSLHVGIDSGTNTNGADRRGLDLAARRGSEVRRALIAAGVRASSIEIGNFGNPDFAREGRVGVLIQTDANAQSPLRSADSNAAMAGWRSHCEFRFDPSSSSVHTADTRKVNEIATYVQQNPSTQVGIDSSVNPFRADENDRTMATRRGEAVREALIEAGVPASSISSGAYGDDRLRRNGRVEVLITSDQRAERP